MKRRLIGLVLCTIPCFAQTPSFTFGYRPQNSTNTTPLQVNGTIPFGSVQAGSSGSMFLNLINQSTTNYRILDTAITGNFFAASAAPVQLTQGSSYSFPLTFSPTSQGTFSAFLTVRLMSVDGFATQFTFNLEGSSPGPVVPPGGETGSVAVSYAFLDRGNNIPIMTGETVPFPASATGARVTAAIVITNRANTATIVNSAAISGAGFEMNGLPLMPLQLISGGETRFNIVFTPTEGVTYSGQLRITISGQPRTYSLSGQGLAGQIAFDLIDRGTVSRTTPGSTIVFQSVLAVTGSSVVAIRARNTGNGESRLSGVLLSGNAFSLLDQPAPPIVLKPNEELTIRVLFSPPDVGEYTGQLRIDSASFALTGKGSGAKLTAWLILDDERFLLRSTARGVIPNTEVGAKRVFAIEVINSGDEAAPIAAIQFAGDGFNLPNVPPLPTRIAPGQSLLLPGTFAPIQVGSVIGFLVIQDLAFQMLGVGSDPPTLPEVRFLGLPETPQALQQPAVGLELATPYPYDLTGSLRMSFSTDTYVDDPAIQFLNGQRAIDFRIPANTRRAIFGTSAQDIRMQTGSLAGTITIVAQISTGKYDLTRNTPPVAVLNMAPSAPVIRAVEFIARASKSFELVITGAATTRTLSRFNFKFTPKTGAKLQTTSLTADVSRTFEQWFQSANSRPYGGQFRASLVFDLTADFGAIESIEVTATNSLGTSAPRVVKTAADK